MKRTEGINHRYRGLDIWPDGDVLEALWEGQRRAVDCLRPALPAIAVPVHGELRHLRAHVALAESCQVRQSVLVENGSILRLAPGQPEVIGQVASGRLGLDGTQLTAMGGPALKMRQRMAHNGTAVATIILALLPRMAGATPEATTDLKRPGSSIDMSILPPDRRTTWRPGIPGGVPHYGAIHTTIDAATFGNGTTDATAAVNGAIQAAGSIATPLAEAMTPSHIRRESKRGKSPAR
jgi:hypothetical protein